MDSKENFLYIKEILESHISADSLCASDYRWKLEDKQDDIIPTLYAFSRYKSGFIKDSIFIVFYKEGISIHININLKYETNDLKECKKILDKFFLG